MPVLQRSGLRRPSEMPLVVTVVRKANPRREKCELVSGRENHTDGCLPWRLALVDMDTAYHLQLRS